MEAKVTRKQELLSCFSSLPLSLFRDPIGQSGHFFSVFNIFFHAFGIDLIADLKAARIGVLPGIVKRGGGCMHLLDYLIFLTVFLRAVNDAGSVALSFHFLIRFSAADKNFHVARAVLGALAIVERHNAHFAVHVNHCCRHTDNSRGVFMGPCEDCALEICKILKNRALLRFQSLLQFA
jgi:hypothetical protein